MTKKNIVYICHSERGPSGGAKIIYDHSEIINSFKDFRSEVVHFGKKKVSKWSGSIKKKLKLNSKYSGWQAKDIDVKENYKFPWFDNKITISNSSNFEKNDFRWVLRKCKKCIFGGPWKNPKLKVFRILFLLGVM